jgi:hypothetical protein
MNCLTCGEKFQFENSYNLHVHQHRFIKKLTLKCYIEDCGIVFSTYDAYRMHRRRKHCENIKKSPTLVIKIDCNLCGEQFINKLDVLKHYEHCAMMTCPLCINQDKVFNNKESFKTHLYRKHKSNFNRPQEAEIIDNQSTISPQNTFTLDPPSDFHPISAQPNFPELFLKLRVEFGTPESALAIIRSEIDIIKTKLTDATSESIQKYCHSNEISEKNCTGLQEAVTLVQNTNLNTSQIKSSYIMNKHFKRHNYVAPRKITLNQNGQKYHFHYVPILRTLRQLLKDPYIRQCIYSPKSNRSPNVYEDYTDGEVYKNNPFWFDAPRIELLLYQDGTELVNPIGSSKLKHKSLGVYFALGNLPYHERIKKENLQLLFIVKERMVKKFGMSVLFEQAIKDIKKLEDVGIDFNIDGQNTNIKGSIVFVLGDNLGSHAVGGFMENFSTTPYFCRYCMITRFDWLTFHWNNQTTRTKSNYQAAVEYLNMNPDVRHFNGIKSDSFLNKLRHYHVANPGLPPCVAHDLLEGVLKFDMKLIINFFVSKKIITYKELNIRYKAVKKQLGLNISLPKLTKAQQNLPGTADENKYFFLLFPLIMIQKNFNRNLYVWRAFLSLLEVTRLATAPKLSTDHRQ